MEMPNLQNLRSEVEKARSGEVVFLCVNVRDEPDVIRNYWDKKGFGMQPVRFPQDGAGARFGVTAFPTTIVIDPTGKVVLSSSGGDLSGVRKVLLDS